MFIKKKGFSLIELSIVLLISGILLTGVVNISSIYARSQKISETKKRISIIKQALNNYFQKNGFLPCPADPTLSKTNSNFGIEQRATNKTCSGTGISGTMPEGFLIQKIGGWDNNKVIFGAVPVKTLLLPEDYSFDAYNNRFTFVALDAYSVNRLSTTVSIYKKMVFAKYDTTSPSDPYSKCTKNNAVTLSYFNVLDANDINNNIIGANSCKLDVKSYSSDTSLLQSDDFIAYVLISHGTNGSGAWNYSGTLNSQPTGSKELGNTYQHYISTYPSKDLTSSGSIDFYQGGIVSDFDDILEFDTISALLQNNDLSCSVFCHTNEKLTEQNCQYVTSQCQPNVPVSNVDPLCPDAKCQPMGNWSL